MSKPTFSVIVPTWNRPQDLAACLDSFLELDYPAGRWELIVVNDGGDVSLTAVTPHHRSALPLQLISIPHSGPAAARNAGARLATGEFLAFTDDDCRIFPNWLQTFADGFANGHLGGNHWDALGGQSVTPFKQNRGEQAWQHLTDFLYDYMQDHDGNALLLISNNVAFRRSAFEDLGGFNETFPLAAAEDMELSYRLLQHGYRQRFYADATVWHYHHLSGWGHIKQQFRYGRGGYYFMKMKRSQPKNLLRKLYEQESFYPSLWQSFRRVGLPLSVAGLVYFGQQAYRIGLRYQSTVARFE